MRKALFIIVFTFILGISSYCQNNLSIENDFKLNPSLLKGYVLTKIQDNSFNNPGVTDNEEIINYFTDNNGTILKVYLELYNNPKNDFEDAGVIVSQFNTEEDLINYIPELIEQSNNAYLIKDNFLIKIWSDAYNGDISNKQISDMVTFYTEKLKAFSYIPTKQAPSTDVSADTIDTNTIDIDYYQLTDSIQIQ